MNRAATAACLSVAHRFTPGGSCRSGTSNVAAKVTLRTRHAHPVLW